MHTIRPTHALLTALALAAPSLAHASAAAQEAAPAFPPSTALAEGLSPDTLARLDELVRTLVDDGDVVGAELLVIKNGKSVLHTAHGWADREAGRPMETGSVFCVRSMTKPVVGAAILMLIEDDLLELDDRVAELLPSFDVEGKRDITVAQLLNHTSGLPMSCLLGTDLHTLDGIQAVAALGGAAELEFDPGTGFHYSDQGTDTLTALIEVTSGMPAADFVRARVLEPLGMRDSACVMTEDSPLRARGLVKYAGSAGQWARFWGPDEPALFPFFLGSQGLYSTLEDYAKFTDLYLRKGRADAGRLLKSRSVRRALTPGPFPLDAPTALPRLRADYGQLMQLWTADAEEEGDARELVAFGHTGSDGTHAWVFPGQRAMVLYFTQSRGTSTGLRVEEALGNLLLGAPFDPSELAPPFDDYLGYYREDREGDLYRAIVRDGDDLALEIMGKGVVPLVYAGEDRWKLKPNPGQVIAFDRSAEGAVTGYHIGDHQELRFEPDEDLPSGAELAERSAAVHRLDLLETLGPLRMTAALEMPKIGVTGQVTTLLVWPDRYRYDSAAAEQSERLAFDGETLWYASTARERAPLEGERAALLAHDNAFARLGDWRRTWPVLEVVQHIEKGDEGFYVVRAGGTDAPATTLYVHAVTGELLMVDALTFVENMGRTGQRIKFEDYRDVSGMRLPHRVEVQLPNPLIGAIVTTITDVELGVAVSDGTFELRD